MNYPGISKTKQRLRYIIADLFTGALAFWLFNIIRYFLLIESKDVFPNIWYYVFSEKLVLELCIIPPCLLGIYWLSGFYNEPFNKSRLQEFTTTAVSACFSTAIIYLVLLTNDPAARRLYSYELILVLFGLLCFITFTARALITGYAIQHFRKQKWTVKVIIVGNSKVSRIVARKLQKGYRNVSYHVSGFVDIPDEKPVKDKETVIPIDQLENVCRKYSINQIILAPANHDDNKVLNLLSQLFPLELPIKISPDTFSFVTSAIRLQDIYGEPFIDLAGPSIGEASKNIKRTFDVSVSLLLLIVLSPLYTILALVVKFSSKGPIFYNQERIGLHQKPFKIHKFRTMAVDAEAQGPKLSSESDPRITKCGRWMRKYRLDELPQFWNVLVGEMSIVGPRPERQFYIKQIVREAPYYTLVCQVRPGITSWGMVKYGYASTVKEMVERTRYDLIYLSNMSLSVDFKILIYTIKTVLGGKGK